LRTAIEHRDLVLQAIRIYLTGREKDLIVNGIIWPKDLSTSPSSSPK
jgi:hypothetical protein